jgi:hypothetical protein
MNHFRASFRTTDILDSLAVQNFLQAKRSAGKKICRQKDLQAKRSAGKKICRQKNLRAKKSVGKNTAGKST